jgi:single-stranded-DNA-specific exonuclease
MSRPESLGRKRWEVRLAVPGTLISRLPHINPILLQILFNRELKDEKQIESFLEGYYLESVDPFLLKDMDKAVHRIRQAIDNDEMIVVYGDFDADGVTATVLLVQALRGLGFERRQAQPYIPDRVDEGYGLNEEALLGLKEKGAGLVIAVDCGIRAIEEVEEANNIGLDVIIADHHSLGPELPPAFAVLNPKQTDSDYPETNLAGVGVAFKLAQALRTSNADIAEFDDADLLDLVALGTVADLVPLLGENRKLVSDGLEVINRVQRPGLDALVRVSGLKAGSITAESIAFGLGPRINAAGRLAHAYAAAKLLAVNNRTMARTYAEQLNQLNRDRQRLTARFSEQAEDMIDAESPLLFAADSEFNPGVVGLVASRLAEKHYRPAIVIKEGDQESSGSCRSIPEFHITEALDRVQDLLVRHGGHGQAAGFTISNENLDAFREQITDVAAAELNLEDLVPKIEIDAELTVPEIDWALEDLLGKLEPTGAENSRPVFLSRDVPVQGHRAVGHEDAHLQLWVGDEQQKLPCIAFRQGAWAGRLPDRIDLVYTIGVNEWNGRRNLQLNVKDMNEAEAKE